MSFLVISHRHELIPFAYRLKHQGETTELLVCTPRFEKAWEGKFDHVMPAREVHHIENLQPIIEMAQRGEVHILCDSLKVSRKLVGVPNLFPTLEFEDWEAPNSALRLGGWWNGEGWENPHLLVCDVGVWPGGMGPAEPGAMTLVRLDPPHHQMFNELMAPLTQLLSPEEESFQGLVQAGLGETPAGRLEIRGASFGWPFLHSHAYVSELDSLASHLRRDPSPLPSRTVVVVPVSVPPWPYRKGVAQEGVPLQGLTPKQIGQVFWHDVRLDPERRTLSSGGLDGLLGVARGAAYSPQLARSRAMQPVLALAVPEKQFRPDAAAQVDAVLAQLEARLGIVL